VQDFIRVLVAEDESLIRRDLVETLNELGHEVVSDVGNGQAAVDVARSLGPEGLDVVLMDISMPVRDGISSADQIISEGIAPVVMLTAYAQTDLMNQAAAAGVFGYLIKPLRQSDLVPALLMARTRWTQFQGLSEEIDALKARKRVSDVTEQAKEMLIERGLSEEQAFSLLRKAAMNGRITIAEAATQVISGVTGLH
jgi:AmiR/NasT family two-component response regulator